MKRFNRQCLRCGSEFSVYSRQEIAGTIGVHGYRMIDGASLDGASLVGASLDGANLRSVRADLFDVLIRARPEVPALLQALRDGRVDGSTYSGECACLCGTIANVRHVDVATLDFKDASRPAERWFLGINKGDTPATNNIAKITEGWLEEFLMFAAPEERNAA